MLDHRKLISSDESAEGDLLTSAAKGSLFALELLAGSMAGSGQRADPATAYALMRIMEMKGNLRTAIGREMLISGSLNQMQRAQAEVEALKILRRMDELEMDLHGSKRPVDIRPIGG